MTFGGNLDFESFKRAFADPDLYPLLGLDIPDAARGKMAVDNMLLRPVYAEWRLKHAPRSTVPAHTQAASPAALSAATPGARNSTPRSPARTPVYKSGGGAAVVVAALLILASYLSVSVGWAIADGRRTGLGMYGLESGRALDQGLIWAVFFLIGALVFAVRGAFLAYHNVGVRNWVYWAGVVVLVLLVVMVVLIVLTSALSYSWQERFL